MGRASLRPYGSRSDRESTLKPTLPPPLDVGLWEECFKLALKGTASWMGTAASVVRQADDIAKLAVAKIQEKRLVQGGKS